MAESECSVNCGVGKKTITSVTYKSSSECTKGDCQPKIEKDVVECDTGIKCDPTYVYGEWGEWTTCSLPCIKHVDERSTKTRLRNCHQSGLPGSSCISGTYIYSGLFRVENRRVQFMSNCCNWIQIAPID